MKLTKNQFQFIVNSDVEMLVLYLQSEQNMSLLEAFDRVYNSRVYEKLMDAELYQELHITILGCHR